MPTYRLIVEVSPNAMLLVDRDRRIEMVNRSAEQLFGYSRAELLGQAVEMLIPKHLRDAHAAHVHGFYGAPQSRAMGAGRDLHGLRKDGTQVPIEIGLDPIETPEGLFMLASIIDITERKRADRAFRAVVEASPSAMLMVDASGTIRLVNRGIEELFGYPRDELIGRAVDVLLPDDVRARHPELVASYFATPESRPMGAGRELFGRRKDGSVVPIEIGLSPIDIEAGQFTLAAIHDITERSRRDRELRRSNADLERFAYIASHDLQEPLRMVANYTELLGQRYRGKLDDRADKYIHYATDGAKRMQQLIRDLLAYSRVGAEGKPMVTVDVGTVMERVRRSLGPTIREHEATLTVGPLPTVRADPSQLEQLLQNLVANAIKFHDDAPPVVEVSAALERGRWCFAVRDNGIGIDAEYATRIFEMFQRLHERGRYEGSGIGLAIAKRIVERHGGELWFTSTPGIGTTFFFTLQPTSGSPSSP
jgi:PAS domain S-box-containing protein